MSYDICVFAGSRSGRREAFVHSAEQLGKLLAERGHGIVYGGGRVGLMGVMADAGLRHGARVTGVIPRALATKELAHPGLHELLVVGTMHERKAKMAALSSAFVALPGGYGTLEELSEVLTWVQLGIYQKPLGLLDVAGYWQPYLALLDHFAAEGFVSVEERKLVVSDEDPGRLLATLQGLAPVRPRSASETDL